MGQDKDGNLPGLGFLISVFNFHLNNGRRKRIGISF